MKQFPFVPIRILYRHVQELVQGAAEVFSIDFNDDLIMKLEGISQGDSVSISTDFDQRNVKESIQGVARASPIDIL